MKKILLFAAAVMFAAAPALAAEKTYSGTISDSKCGAHHAAGEHGAKTDATECTNKCVDAGAKFVFVSKGKVYQIANQDFTDLKAHAGHNVKLTGDMAGDSITVSKIEMPMAKTAK
jgi:hypothetical protein